MKKPTIKKVDDENADDDMSTGAVHVKKPAAKQAKKKAGIVEIKKEKDEVLTTSNKLVDKSKEKKTKKEKRDKVHTTSSKSADKKNKKLDRHKADFEECLATIPIMLLPEGIEAFDVAQKGSFVVIGINWKIGVWIHKRAFYVYDAKAVPESSTAAPNALGGLQLSFSPCIRSAWESALWVACGHVVPDV